jgi:hypothetical protein
MDLTIDELGLTEYAINGILNIYAVQRMISVGKVDAESGKDAIFVNGSCWVSQNSLTVTLDLSTRF